MLCYVILYSLSTILYKLKEKEGKKTVLVRLKLETTFL